MEKILKLFQPVPTSSMPKELIVTLLGFGAFLILMYFLVKFIRKKTKNKLAKKTLRELPTGLMSFGIATLILVWMRLESVPIFSMRIWWVVYWIIFIVWAGFKIKKYFIIKRRLERAKRK